MSKIGIEPIRSIFGIAVCVFQMAALGRFELHVSWMRIRYTRPTIRKSLVAGAGFEPAKPEGKRFWRGRWGTIPQPSDRQSEALTNWATPSQSLLVDQLEYPALIGDSTEAWTLILWMKTRIPNQLEDRVKTSLHQHLSLRSCPVDCWEQTAVILSCCIGVASDHTLLCREKKIKIHLIRFAYQLHYSPKFLEGLVGFKPTPTALNASRAAVCIFQVVPPQGLEPWTPGLRGPCSDQLS